MSVALQSGTVARIQLGGIQIAGLVLAAGIVGALAAVAYRQRTARPLPAGLAGLLGLSTVAVWLLADVIGRGSVVASLPLDHYGSAVYTVVGAGLGTGFGVGGRHLGDWVTCEIYDIDRLRGRGEAVELLRSARTLVSMTLPHEIGDAEGYATVEDETKRDLEATTLQFPSRLSRRQLVDRLESRIVTDFDVDHASATVDADREITSLIVGKRPDGLGVTLPPGTVAVDIAADPAGDGTPGDPVEIWDGSATTSTLAARGRLRSAAGDRATVVVEEGDLSALDTNRYYRLVTPPATPSDRHRLAAVLRAVDETTVAVTVHPGDDLEGEFVGWLPGTAIVVDREDGIVTLPDDKTTLQAGDTVYLVGRPEDLASHEGVFTGGRRADRSTDQATPLTNGAD